MRNSENAHFEITPMSHLSELPHFADGLFLFNLRPKTHTELGEVKTGANISGPSAL
jgi:hypothetical protein